MTTWCDSSATLPPARARPRSAGGRFSMAAPAPRQVAGGARSDAGMGGPSRPQADPGQPGQGRQTPERRQARSVLSEEELARLADARAAMEAEHRLSPTATAAIRLLLLSGCRKSEILSLRWERVDIERGVLRLPESKTGAKVVPLAAAAVKLLAELPRHGDYVLRAAKGVGHYTGLQKDWERVRAGMGGSTHPRPAAQLRVIRRGRRQQPLPDWQGAGP